MRYLSYFFSMTRVNFKAALADRRSFMASLISMALNNLLWFSLWVIFFSQTQSLKGWTLADVARLYSIGSISAGLCFLAFGGMDQMIRQIQNNQLDIYLTYPKPVLMTLLLSRADPEALGDILSGIILAYTLGSINISLSFAILALSIPVSIFITSFIVLLYSSVFWSNAYTRVAEEMILAFIGISTSPLSGIPKWAKIIIFTVIPAGFISILPVEILREFNVWYLLALLSGAIFFGALALFVFHRGLRRYTSGNRFVAVR